MGDTQDTNIRAHNPVDNNLLVDGETSPARTQIVVACPAQVSMSSEQIVALGDGVDLPDSDGFASSLSD